MSKNTKKTARYKGWRVVWHGGEYAEILPPGGRVPVDALNFWDHDADAPLRDYTSRDLRDELATWYKDNEGILSDHLAAAGY